MTSPSESTGNADSVCELSPIWLRAEERIGEARTPLTPNAAAHLIARGRSVTVETSRARCVPDHAYVAAGCTLAPAGSWRTAPDDALILGLKEIDASHGPFRHRHVHFAHVYKHQRNWRSTLRQFSAGGGVLYDMEALLDERGRRQVAFGYWAGFVATALGVIAWCRQRSEEEAPPGPLTPWSDADHLLDDVQRQLASVPMRPRLLITGRRGRSGRGAQACANGLGLTTRGWQRAHTAGPPPHDGLLDHDILVHCIYTTDTVAPFTTREHLACSARRLSVIVDVTCDLAPGANALPLLEDCTTLESPVHRLIAKETGPSGQPPLDVIAIDHLPSLLPTDSSADFSAQLLRLLCTDTPGTRLVWAAARRTFERKRREALGCPTIHWLGAGLSSGPGIERLGHGELLLTVWDGDAERARAAVGRAGEHGVGARMQVRHLDWGSLPGAVQPGDVVVSMLPADCHARVAQLCVHRDAHFVCSSYRDTSVSHLAEQATATGLCMTDEVGLDPGIDHLFAHALVAAYRGSPAFDPNHRLSFRSFCGGFPAVANDFRYKFSWSPAGVLRALNTPATWIDGGAIRRARRVWDAVRHTTLPVASGGTERFEAYPNRDSLPFIERYGIGPDWRVDEFVRGTLRLDGWSDAWRDVFDELATLDAESDASADERIQSLSQRLWDAHAYARDEADRVVLSVELEVRTNEGQPVWHRRRWLDMRGGERSAMSRLVSWTVSLAVDDIVEGRTPIGLHSTPTDLMHIERWLDRLKSLGVPMHDCGGRLDMDRCAALKQGVRRLFDTVDRSTAAAPTLRSAARTGR